MLISLISVIHFTVECYLPVTCTSYRAITIELTMDWDPLRWWICPFPATPLGPIGPMVPLCVRSCPFWCGNVWNCIALLGSISSRNPSRWNVAYGQISSSIPGKADNIMSRGRCGSSLRAIKWEMNKKAFTFQERKCLQSWHLYVELSATVSICWWLGTYKILKD